MDTLEIKVKCDNSEGMVSSVIVKHNDKSILFSLDTHGKKFYSIAIEYAEQIRGLHLKTS